MIRLLAFLLVAFPAFAQNSVRELIPAQGCEAVTPSDVTSFDASRLVLVGGTGALRVTFNNGTTATLPATIVTNAWAAPLSITKVFSTGTTATDIWVCR